MSYILVFVALAALLFALSYIVKRRFGVLVLALLAGSLLANLWTADLTPLVASTGIVTVRPPLSSIVALVVTLAPAFVLFLGGPVAHGKHERLVGSLIFAIVATMLSLNWINDALVIEGAGKVLHDILLEYQALILTVGVIAAIVDVLMTHTVRHQAHSKH
jgi:hypothetical protein